MANGAEPTPKNSEELFWRNVDKRGPDECWEWKRARNSSGYGRLGSTAAHRVAWHLTNGQIPDGMYICHHCDNPPCCNPAHLFCGTQTDNMQDAKAKNRFDRRNGHVWGPGLDELHPLAPPTYKNVRSDVEIDDLIDRSWAAAVDGTRYPHVTYERGVLEAIEWIFGFTEENPLEV